MKISLVGGIIGALVLINAGTLVAVDRHFQVAAVPSSTQPVGTNAAPSPNITAATASPVATAAAGGPVSSPGVFVTAVSADRAWRASNSGGCGGTVQVQATQDGGRTWTTLAKPPAGAATAIGIDGTGHLQLSGQASDGCRQQTWSLSTGGSWYAAGAASWAPEGVTSSDVIHAGKRLRACAAGSVIDIATAGDHVDVLCSNGTVRAVSAKGPAATVYQSPGLLSIGTTSDDSLVVARSMSGCDGVELDKVVGKAAHRLTCVKGASKAVDLTFAGDHGWLVAAHNTWTGAATGNWSKS